MEDKSRKIIQKTAWLCLLMGLWILFFVMGRAADNFFGIEFYFDSPGGLTEFSGFMFLLIGFELSRILRIEEKKDLPGMMKKRGHRIVAYAIIIAFSAFVLWFMWTQVYSVLLNRYG